MKRTLLAITLVTIAFFSCSRQGSTIPSPISIEGNWRMILVTDNVTAQITTKPSSVQHDVDITFTQSTAAKGTFSGKTPTNEIAQNDYSIGTHGTLSIPSLSMTKVMETSWGSEFVDHIRSSQTYSFESNGNLSIKTAGNTLTFKKL